MKALVLSGPSGSGKSNLALQFAASWQRRFPERSVEIICADSITVYRGCDIGSAKPSADEQKLFPHHLLDLRDPDQEFTAADFVNAADPILQRCYEQNKLAILVGGTGFYLRALLQGMTEQDPQSSGRSQEEKAKLTERFERDGIEPLYQEMLARDPALLGNIHANDHYRVIRALQAMNTTGRRWSELNEEAKAKAPRYQDVRFFCCELPREELRLRVETRSQAMLEAGLVEEVQGLLQKYPANSKALQSVGYKECLAYLGYLPSPAPPQTLPELAAAISQSTMQLAKRQMTWFRGEKGVEFLRCAKTEDFLPTLHEMLLLS